MCGRSPRKGRCCVWVVAAILVLWHPSSCSAALDPATAPHDSHAQRRSLLQAYVTADSSATAEVSADVLPANQIASPAAADDCDELRVQLRAHKDRCKDVLRPPTCVDLGQDLYSLCGNECVVNLQRLYNRAHYLRDCDLDNEVLIDNAAMDTCLLNTDCCSDQRCLPFGADGRATSPHVCGFSQCIVNATAGTWSAAMNQTCVSKLATARGNPTAGAVLMNYEVLCMRHDGSNDLCFRQTNELIRLMPDVNCGQAEGIGCCLGTYLKLAEDCQYSGFSTVVYEQLTINEQARLRNISRTCSVPLQPCSNFKVEELGLGRCRAGPHETASAAPPSFAGSLLLAAAGLAWLLAALA